MMHSRYAASLILITLFLTAFRLSAQQVPGTVWKQRETERFILIYPQSMSDEASNLAAALDDVLNTLNTDLPAGHPHKKWPLVLTNLGLETNGFVTLLPRHSVWYAAPGEDFTAVSDWWMLLARHEGRHMAQFDAADQGTTRLLHTLFGEIGWGAGIVMGTPSWLMEGDAVVMETRLSGEGRGRDPLFTMQVPAMIDGRAAAGESYNYHRAVNPSYKNHIPDIYHSGYALTDWIRTEYGDEAVKEIFRSTARIPIPVIGLNSGIKRATGKKARELYREMAQSIRELSLQLQSSVSWTPAIPVTPVPDSFTRYEPLYSAPGGVLYARKISYTEAPALVRIDRELNEERLIRLPRYGRVSVAAVPSGLRIAWNSIRRHPVYLGSSVSDITVADLDSRGRITERKTIIKGSRYLYPALSPDGKQLAAVELLENGSGALVILNAETGKELKRRDFTSGPTGAAGPPVTPAYPSWSPDGRKLVFSLRSSRGRRIAEWRVAGDEVMNLCDETLFTVKNPVYSGDGTQVFYSSNESGIEAVWTLPAHRIAARRWYGTYRPLADPTRPGTLYVVEYASELGERISRVNLNQSSVLEEKLQIPGAEAEANQSNRPAQTTSDNTSEKAFPESDYVPRQHVWNIHSWGLNYPLMGTELRLGIESRDVLGTLSFKAGGLYEFTEGSPGAYTVLSLTAIRPVISISGEYRYRSPGSDPFHQSDFSISALYPANLSRTGIWYNHLEAGLSAGLLSRFPAGSGKAEHNPVLRYKASWSRLRPGSVRAFRPDLGWKISTQYSQIPLPGNYRDSASTELKLYFPGGFRNTSLSLGGGIEYRSADFSPIISRPRGYDWDNPELTVLGTIDYEFPLGYPDLPLGSVIYIQRFRLGLFSDFGFTGEYKGVPEHQWSTGAALTMDFAAFDNFPGLSIGLQFSWRWLDNTPRLSIMVMEMPIF